MGLTVPDRPSLSAAACSVGREVINRELDGWTEPCPDDGIHTVLMPLQGRVLRLCDNHIIDFGRQMELQQVDLDDEGTG